MKAIERLIIQKRKTLIKRSKKIFERAIREQYLQALHTVELYSFDQLKEHIRDTIKPEPIENAFNYAYASTAEIALIWRNKLLPPKKDGVDDIYRTVFERNLREYGRVKAGKRITNITGTTRDRIESVVQDATSQAIEDGLGITDTKTLILESIRSDYMEFTEARAQLIAQTEIITASNQAAMEGARSTGMEFRKFWSTSGIGNSRQSHVDAEQESIDKNGLREDESFDANGLMFPGDPMGPPEEVCNCHCTLLIELV